MLALSAVMPDAPTRPMFQELEDEGIEPFEVPNLWLGSNEPDTYVDITDTIDLKIKSLEQHVSQGGAEAEPWVRLRAQETGEQAGCAYAEAFKAFRFVDDPVGGVMDEPTPHRTSPRSGSTSRPTSAPTSRRTCTTWSPCAGCSRRRA